MRCSRSWCASGTLTGPPFDAVALIAPAPKPTSSHGEELKAAENHTLYWVRCLGYSETPVTHFSAIS